jgi:hypothetical protein
VLPLLKVTVPVGTAVPVPFTVAVNVMLVPAVAVVADAVRDVVVATTAGLTVTVTALELEAASVVVPPYLAIKELLPTGREVVVRVATPELLSVAVPNEVEPL